jgi:Zn-dependent peptidase ImmA (M78 family)
MNSKDIRSKAYVLLNKYGINTIPVDIEKIAKGLNCKIFRINPKELQSDIPCDKEKFSGAIIKNKNNEEEHFIFLNKFDSPQRQTFTIAHELGHLQLGTDNQIDCRESMYSNDKNELDANEFAGNILMPHNWLKEAINGGDDNQILAYMFGVSVKAIEFRRNQLHI